MKLLIVLVVSLFAFDLAVQSDCTPDASTFSFVDEITTCWHGRAFKKTIWSFTWPDGMRGELRSVGNGDCCRTSPCCYQGTPNYAQCWPVFDPIKIQDGRVEQTTFAAVANCADLGECAFCFTMHKYHFGGCIIVGQPTINEEVHTCSSGRGDDEEFDGDSDGYTISEGDCDDGNPDVHPGAFIDPPGGGSCDDLFPIGDDRNCNNIDDYYEMCTPVIIDIEGNGFDLTSGADGVNFDLDRNGVRERLAWTATGSDDAWLALDRNHNGWIDDGGELFGNYSPQPNSPHKNGFLALAEFDKRANGGNGDRIVDNRDSIYPSLWLWQDRNHNGLSERGELSALSTAGLASIDLDYRQSKRRDRYGNWFRYQAKTRDARGEHIARWAYDVFLTRPGP
jgi:hypothetical protein